LLPPIVRFSERNERDRITSGFHKVSSPRKVALSISVRGAPIIPLLYSLKHQVIVVNCTLSNVRNIKSRTMHLESDATSREPRADRFRNGRANPSTSYFFFNPTLRETTDEIPIGISIREIGVCGERSPDQRGVKRRTDTVVAGHERGLLFFNSIPSRCSFVVRHPFLLLR